VGVKEQHLALSSGISLAGHTVELFWDHGDEALDTFKDEIIISVLKPNKKTAIHHYLSYFQDIYEELHNLQGNLELVYTYEYILRTIKDVNLNPNIPLIDENLCENYCSHNKCENTVVIKEWIKYANANSELINELIVHSAFQILLQDRNFLHDFHVKLAVIVEDEIENIISTYPEFVTNKKKIKRQHFPVWLKSAIFYRDKGTCVICRCDLSNLVRNQNQIHIDHIVPLNLYGTNDASNMQLLCESCNTSKGDRNTITSALNVPFWNL